MDSELGSCGRRTVVDGTSHLVVTNLGQVDGLDVGILPRDLAVVVVSVRELHRNRGGQVDGLGVLVDGLLNRLRITHGLRCGIGTSRDVCNRTVQRTGDGALDIEYGIGGQLSVGHLTPRDGEVTARTVGVYGAHGGGQLQIIGLGTGLHQSVDFVHAHRLDGVRLELGSTHDGALREDHAQLVGFDGVGELHFVAFVPVDRVGLAVSQFHILPVTVSVSVLKLPR